MTDSLKHRAAAAEVHLLLCPDGKSEAVKIIEDSSETYADYLTLLQRSSYLFLVVKEISSV